MLPWHEDVEIKLAKEEEGLYRMQLDRFGPRGGGDWSVRVCLYFAADEERAREIEQVVREWRKRASV